MMILCGDYISYWMLYRSPVMGNSRPEETNPSKLKLSNSYGIWYQIEAKSINFSDMCLISPYYGQKQPEFMDYVKKLYFLKKI